MAEGAGKFEKKEKVEEGASQEFREAVGGTLRVDNTTSMVGDSR